MDADPLPVDLGKRLRAAREYAGYSNANDFAEQVGWKPSNWGRLERGQRTLKEWEADGLLPKVARLCKIPVDWFTAPWGQALTAQVAQSEPEPEWLGRLEDQLELIGRVLRGAYPDLATQVAAEMAAGVTPDAGRRLVTDATRTAASRKAVQRPTATPSKPGQDPGGKPGSGQAA